MNKQSSEEKDLEVEDELIADVIYVVLKKNHFTARSIRMQWFLQRVNTKITISSLGDENDPYAAIVSIIPQDKPTYWTTENSKNFKYLVTISTDVVFLDEVYRLVYCLDISPSVSTVDGQQGEVLIDLIIEALRKSVECLVQPVLVQGLRITRSNTAEFLEVIQRQLEYMEDAVVKNVTEVTDYSLEDHSQEMRRVENFTDNKTVPSEIGMVSPGSGFLNLLRYGMLAMNLLPVSNFSNLIVFTDGMIVMPDMDILDSVLNHMRYNEISCHFVHIGSNFHPHCSLGFVPYSEMLQLISVATNGFYIPCFLTWNLKRKPVILDLSTPRPRDEDWKIPNRHFYGNRGPQLLCKKHSESDTHTTFFSILATRIREGFILDYVEIKSNIIYAKFVLPWTNHIYLEYSVYSQWPIVQNSNSTKCFLSIRAPYEFLHDISCHQKSVLKSPFRRALIARFWSSLKSFTRSDALLSHLETFMNNPSSYYLPESIRNSVPLYCLPAEVNNTVFGSTDLVYTQFAQTWKPSCLLNHSLWQKWFHTERAGVLFQHDEPFDLFCKKDANDKLQEFECKRAMATFFNFLKSKASFVLVEKNSFVKFLLPNESGTGKHSFYIIRIMSKPPYAVIHVAFLYNIPEHIRRKAMKELKQSILALKISQFMFQKDFPDTYSLEALDKISYNNQLNCCMILEKPLEKILIRYEQVPNEFKTVVFPDGTQPPNLNNNLSSTNSSLITTLSRYLHHRRWIWKATTHQCVSLPFAVIESVLSTLIKIRLQEGFCFAHVTSGIINMVLEVQMKDSLDRCEEDELYFCNGENYAEKYPTCIIQYVLFPPKVQMEYKLSLKDGEMSARNEYYIELVNECWVEPQHGIISRCPANRRYISNLRYPQLPDAIWNVDSECIAALFTYEYIKLMCENVALEAPPSVQNLLTHSYAAKYLQNAVPFTDQRINQIPFAFSFPNLLYKCHQNVILLNLFSVDVLNYYEESLEPNKLLLELIYDYLGEIHNKDIMITGYDAYLILKHISKKTQYNKKLSSISYGSSSTSGNMNGNGESSDSLDKLPSFRDWARMIAWALGKSDEYFDTASILDEELSGGKASIGCSVEIESEPPVIDDTNEISEEDVDWVKWKCYLKFVSKDQCFVTLVPDNLESAKRLTLDDSAQYRDGVFTILRPNREKDASDSLEDASNCVSTATKGTEGSIYTSCLSNVLSSCDSVAVISAPKGIILSPTTPPYTPSHHGEKSSPFRLRASTWGILGDVRGEEEDRLRTNSLGAKVKPVGGKLKPKELFCNNEGDYSAEDMTNPACLLSHDQKLSKYIPLEFPVYVYNCNVKDIVDFLVYKEYYSQCENAYASEMDKFSGQYEEDKVPESKEEMRMRNHCDLIKSSINRILVIAAFKSLRRDHHVSITDMNKVISMCVESVIVIDITEYLKMVCRDLKRVSTTNGDENGVNSILAVCSDLNFIHKTIQKKFVDILKTHFKAIPCKPDLYYCFPLWGRKQSSNKSPSCEAIKSALGSSSVVNSAAETSENASTAETQKTCKTSVSTTDGDKLEKIPAAKPEMNLLEEVCPLFLRLTCKVACGNTVLASRPIQVIPTCIHEVLNKFNDIDVGNLKVTINLFCLTLPFPQTIRNASNKKINPICEDFPKEFSQLPDYQYNALDFCVSQIKWLMKDEIITFMLDVSPVKYETLKMVCNHIESSPCSLSCCMEKVPFNFIFNDRKSLESFLKDFVKMKIGDYSLKQDKDLYYLINNAVFTKKCPKIDGRECIEYNKNYENKEDDHQLKTIEEEGGVEDRCSSVSKFLKWILERDSNKAGLPNFWLIMSVGSDSVAVYFYCRFLEIHKSAKKYITVWESVVKNINQLCRVVNQKLLLHNLHFTRMCDQLLDADPEGEEDDDEGDEGSIRSEISSRCFPGSFACDVVWETNFSLHPRLKTGPIKAGTARRIQALHSVLNKFSVLNRTNLFVYQDTDKNVFYIRIFDHVQSSKSFDSDDTTALFSRSSSFSSLNKKHFEEPSITMDESRVKKCGEGTETFSHKLEDYITLKVYGISDVGCDIKCGLVELLQRRLDDAVLEVISIMLGRNPQCRLLPDDVHFIQKPGDPPECILQFTLNNKTFNYLHPLYYLLKQNLKLVAYPPKYTDVRSTYHFQDYSEPNDSPRRIKEADLLLYNQNPTHGIAIACLAFAIVRDNGQLIDCESEEDVEYEPDIVKMDELASFTETCVCKSRKTSRDKGDEGVFVEFRIWKQGRLNVDILAKQLTSAVRNSLWEVVTEFSLLISPLFTPGSNNATLCNTYHAIMPEWLKFATKLGVPTVRVQKQPILAIFHSHVILRELNNIIPAWEASSFVFCCDRECRDKCYVPAMPQANHVLHIDDTCIIVAYNNAPFICCEKKLDFLTKQNPKLQNHDDYHWTFRKRLLLFVLSHSEITLLSYNCPKDKMESTMLTITNLAEWIKTRTDFHTGIISQKLGIFHQQPLQRKADGVGGKSRADCMVEKNLDILLRFPLYQGKRRCSLQLQDVFHIYRDCKLPRDALNHLPRGNLFLSTVYQLNSLQNIGKKAQEKNFLSNWQMKGSVPNTQVTDEILNYFFDNARLVHYCLTPLLFLPRWRIAAAATRDHSLSLKTQSQFDKSSEENDDKWHNILCSNFVYDYKQYLQSLGFIPLKIISTGKNRKNSDTSVEEEAEPCYLRKFLLGGVLLYSIHVSEPFFQSKLFILEYNRSKYKGNNHFSLSFLDELDRVKLQMHLHSFTYDYHLRCSHQLIADQQSVIRRGYHITSFLDDFIKYYPKAPNYARSLVHTDLVIIKDITLPPNDLFNFLLRNADNYGMDVFSLHSSPDNKDEFIIPENGEYVLVSRKNTPSIYYKDMNDVQQMDDFDITIIVSNISVPPEYVIKLQIYILLTSRRDLYPKLEMEKKLGKFRTVSTTNENATNSTSSTESDSSSNDNDEIPSAAAEEDVMLEVRKKSQTEIRQELVNYLGYYSSHEEVMHNLMMEETEIIRNQMEWMITKGAIDCETEILWNRLLHSMPMALTYGDLETLLSLSEIFDVSDNDPLNTLMADSDRWLQPFLKLLRNKHSGRCRFYTNADRRRQFILVLHSNFPHGFVALNLIDKKRCASKIVMRKDKVPKEGVDFYVGKLAHLLESVVNLLCYHMWIGTFNRRSNHR